MTRNFDPAQKFVLLVPLAILLTSQMTRGQGYPGQTGQIPGLAAQRPGLSGQYSGSGQYAVPGSGVPPRQPISGPGQYLVSGQGQYPGSGQYQSGSGLVGVGGVAAGSYQQSGVYGQGQGQYQSQQGLKAGAAVVYGGPTGQLDKYRVGAISG